MLENVVHVRANGRQHIDKWNVAAGAEKALIHRTIDDQRRVPAERLQLRRQLLGLAAAIRRIEDDELALGLLLRQRGDEP